MEKDPRNDLYIQYARFLKKYKPKMFVFENVPGMLTAKKGLIWKRIQQRLRTVGYNIEYRLVNAFVLSEVFKDSSGGTGK